jgi:hypothetical protein
VHSNFEQVGVTLIRLPIEAIQSIHKGANIDRKKPVSIWLLEETNASVTLRSQTLDGWMTVM